MSSEGCRFDPGGGLVTFFQSLSSLKNIHQRSAVHFLHRKIREKFIEGGSNDTDGFFPQAPSHRPMNLIGSSSRRIETHNSLISGLEAFERTSHGSTSCKTNIPFLFPGITKISYSYKSVMSCEMSTMNMKHKKKAVYGVRCAGGGWAILPNMNERMSAGYSVGSVYAECAYWFDCEAGQNEGHRPRECGGQVRTVESMAGSRG